MVYTYFVSRDVVVSVYEVLVVSVRVTSGVPVGVVRALVPLYIATSV